MKQENWTETDHLYHVTTWMRQRTKPGQWTRTGKLYDSYIAYANANNVEELIPLQVFGLVLSYLLHVERKRTRLGSYLNLAIIPPSQLQAERHAARVKLKGRLFK